jgi:hypothetical protein
MSSAFTFPRAVLTEKFQIFPADLRARVQIDYNAALLGLVTNAEHGIVNGLKPRYAVMSSSSTRGDPTSSKADVVVFDNITTISSANIALLIYFMAHHSNKIVMAGTAAPAITRHTGDVLRPAVLPGGSNFVEIRAGETAELGEGQIGWAADLYGRVSFLFKTAEKVEMRVWAEMVKGWVEGISGRE